MQEMQQCARHGGSGNGRPVPTTRQLIGTRAYTRPIQKTSQEEASNRSIFALPLDTYAGNLAYLGH